MKRPLLTTVLTACVAAIVAVIAASGAASGAALGAGSRAEEEPAGAAPVAELVDRIVAVVDEDPILASALDRAIGLGLVSQGADESDLVFRRRVLDQMLAERLRAHEVDRFGFTEISLAQVDRAVAALESGFADHRAFEERLSEFGLTMDDIRQIVARQVMVLTYVDERLGPRVFVSLDDIREYYDSVLTPEMKSTGQRVPDLDRVREEIRDVLREQRLNEEIERWTEELRREADIEDYFDRSSDTPAEVLIGVSRAPD
ncbi:MAG: hypothetical protein IH936_15895 [Acidobacteria bacterium]|nr:hypothetical protein [Acidobacteriota bacterium]